VSQGIFQILRLELDDDGLQFSNFFTRQLDIEFSFGEVFLIMLSAMIFHLLLMIYIDQVFPGELGIPKKWFFPIKMLIELCKSSKAVNEDEYISLNSEALRIDIQNTSNFEEEPTHLKLGIQVNNLSKQFGTKIAVNNLNLNMYEDQITVLLG
jgi:ATP-binding cassette subfamily A (ABC1) protein 3